MHGIAQEHISQLRLHLTTESNIKRVIHVHSYLNGAVLKTTVHEPNPGGSKIIRI